MPVDVGLAIRKALEPYPSMRLGFDDDGYYWFCYPHFEQLADETGQMIDLYDGAWFHGPQLDALRGALARIAEIARQMPERWDECVGHSMGSHVAPTPPAAINKAVVREVLLSRIAKFQELVAEARAGDLWIACLGD